MWEMGRITFRYVAVGFTGVGGVVYFCDVLAGHRDSLVLGSARQVASIPVESPDWASMISDTGFDAPAMESGLRKPAYFRQTVTYVIPTDTGSHISS
jgi:hypothetical protein